MRIAIESPLQDEVRDMVTRLNAHLSALSPPEICFQLTVEEMATPATTLFVARDGKGAAIGMGALHRHGEIDGEAVAEVKRMFTEPAARGCGVGWQILGRILDLAREHGIQRLVLQTGDERHADAHRLYRRAGFLRCGPVLDYPDNPLSWCFEMRLAAPRDARLSS